MQNGPKRWSFCAATSSNSLRNSGKSDMETSAFHLGKMPDSTMADIRRCRTIAESQIPEQTIRRIYRAVHMLAGLVSI